MKNAFKIITTIICASALALLPACQMLKGVSGDEAQVEAIAGVLQSGTSIGVQTVVLNTPDSARYFQTAAVAIRFAVAEGTLTPQEILDTVRLYVTELPGGENYVGLIEVGVGLALNTYRTFYDVNVGERIPVYLKTLLMAVADGIDQGLNVSVRTAGPKDNPLNDLTVEDLTL